MNSDRQGRSHPGVTFPLIFYLLHVDCDHAGVAGTCHPGISQARCLGSNFWYGDSHPLLVSYGLLDLQFTVNPFFFSFLGGVESAVAIIVCNMSVIIPAILRALGVGDPFMQEDTVDPKFTTGVEIARMTTSRIELGLLTSRGTEITDGSTFRGAISTVVSGQRDSVDSDARDQERRLGTQTSHGSLGNFRSTSRVEPPLVDGSGIAHPLTQVRSLPVVGKDQDIEADVGRRHTKNNST